MSRVDFYILPDNVGIDHFACKITQKACHLGNRVYIHTPSGERADTVDGLLWTFRDISFVPHEIYNGSVEEDTPVSIGYSDHCPGSFNVMINLGNDVPAFADQFDRIVEIVGGNETDKQYARQRYRQYKEKQCELHEHKID